MAQYIIDIGAVPDDGQGDPLRTAFDYTNENFNQIFAAGPVLSNIQIANNTITTTVLNSNLILSPSGIGRIQLNNTLFPRLDDVYDIGTPSVRFNSIYLGTGGINTTGGISTTGNITANYFIGNGSQLTGIVATTGSEVVNGSSNILIPSAGSNIFVTVNGTSNVATFANTGAYVAGTVSATGNISGNYILGNGALLTGINIGYGNSNVADFLPTYTGNLVSLTGPVTTTANVTGGNLRTAGQVSATGNITGGNVATGRLNAGYITVGTTISAIGNITSSSYFIGDGSLLTGINANYGNANVTAFLPTYTGNLSSLTGPVTTTANVTGGNLQTAGSVLASGNITAANLDTNRINAANITASGLISAVANITTSAYFIGDGSQLTNLPAGNYSNANVAAYLPTYTGSIPSLTGLLRTTANIVGGNISIVGNITGGNVDAGRVNAGNLTVSGPVSAVGNITTSAYFIGDGSQLTNLPAGNYSNANVAAFLPTYTGNLVSLTGPVTTTANVTGGNLTTLGQISALGNITGGNVDASRVNANTVTVTTTISAGGNVTGNNLIGATVVGATVSATANVVGGNITTGGQISATGNIQGGNLNAPGGTVISNIVSATGRVQGGNFVTTGSITATGNITGGNVDTGNVHAANINVDSIVSAIGNVYGNNLIGSSLSVTGNLSAGNVSISGTFGAASLSASGNITGGNLLTAGNVLGSYFVGNGALLTGITVSAGTSILNGNSNVVVTANGNVTISSAGVSNVLAISNTGAYVIGEVSATGNVSGNYFIGNGAFITGLPAGYSNADVANYLPTYSGNLPNLTGLVSTTGNVAGNYFIGNGSLLTGVSASDVSASALTGNTLSSNVLFSSLTSVGNLANLNVTGNAAVGNVLTGGLVSVTGNATVGNLSTAGLLTASGNITGGNLTTIGLITASGNITGGNILSNNYYYANGTPVPPGIIYTANTAPPVSPAPKVTDQWYDTANDVLYEYLYDGTSNYWIDTTSPAFAGGVVANVAISGTLLPIANVSYDVGNSTAYFRNTYTQNLYTNNRLPAYNMPLGAVVQTVMSSSLGGSITNSTSYADVTYANVTITPSSATSKVLVIATGTSGFTSVVGQNISADTQLVRSPSISLQIQTVGATGVGATGAVSYSYLDSPGTTSPVTYKLQQKVSNASSTLTSTNIWLIAQEIAAS